jgi:dolichol kinase
MLEIRRKVVHAAGILTIFLILWFGKWTASLIILAIALLLLSMGEYRKNKDKYKIVKSKKIDEFEDFVEGVFKEHERPKTLPFQGATEFFIGCFIATVLFEPTTAIASISVLSLADSMSTLIGSYYGKHKLRINRKKTFEGSSAFLLTAFFALLFFANPLKAFLVAFVATITEALPNVDDNLTIPIVVGLAMILIS